MTQAEIVRNNARIILKLVRGKAAEERRLIYFALAHGPLGLPLLAIHAAIKNAEGNANGIETIQL